MRTGPIPYDPEERIFTIDDVVRLFRRLRNTLLKAAFLGAVIAFCLLVTQESNYSVEATFKEGAEKSGSDGGLRDLLSGLGGGGSQPQAVVLMKSAQVLRPLAERFGLQASISRGNRISNGLRSIRNNLLAERGRFLPEVDWFAFEKVTYDGERGLSYQLRFIDRSHFEVFTNSGEKLAEGEVGTPVHLAETTFTCIQIPSRLLLRKHYSLSISPWLSAVGSIKGSFKIASQKSNNSIYDLMLLWPNRQEGAALLNGLMEEYRAYLKRSYNQIASEQMAYLEQRQEQSYQKIEKMFDEHAAYLKKSILETGAVGLKDEIEACLKPHAQLREKLFFLEVELSRLSQEAPSLFALDENYPDQMLLTLFGEMQTLKQQRELLEVSAQQNSSLGQGMGKHLEELASVRSQKEEVEQLLQTKQAGKWVLPPALSWAQEIRTSAQQVDLSDYLSNHLRLLNVREKVLQERLTHLGSSSTELDGIDLETSQKLFSEYLGKLDFAETSMRHYARLKEDLQKSDFELGSLAAVLRDPVSEKIIERANALSLQLKDEAHRSTKEGERWTQEIALHRKLLGEHLEQLWNVEDLNIRLIRERLATLQGAQLDCINQRLSVLDERMHNAIEQRKKELNEEKHLLGNKMEELRLSAKDLPEKWKQENWLDLKTKMANKLMTVMAELVESKTIGHHLHHVESKPLDLAIPPLLAKKPKLYLFSFAGAFAGAFALFFFALVRTILNGFPTFSRKLLTMRYPFSGVISSFCDGPAVEALNGPDLETLRQVSLFLNEKKEKIVGLIGGRGPDYSYALAQNLGRAGRQILLVRCDFGAKFQESDRPGLLQWLQGDGEVPVRRGEGFDFIPTGGFSPFGMEALQSERFKTLLEQCKEAYDFVLVWLRAPLDVAEAKALLSFSEKAVVTVSGEQIEELTPFIDWAYDKKRITFISCE